MSRDLLFVVDLGGGLLCVAGLLACVVMGLLARLAYVRSLGDLDDERRARAAIRGCGVAAYVMWAGIYGAFVVAVLAFPAELEQVLESYLPVGFAVLAVGLAGRLAQLAADGRAEGRRRELGRRDGSGEAAPRRW